MNRLSKIVLMIFMISTTLYGTGIEYLTPNLIDLGRAHEGSVLDGTIRFVNGREDSIRIERVRTSCGCTAAGYSTELIAPGDTSEIQFTFRTRGFNGVARKTITIHFDSEYIPPRIFTIQANIFKEVDVAPRYIQFPTIKVNPDTVLNHLISIVNNADKSIKIQNAECDFDLIRPVLQSVTVPKGGQAFIKLEFKPVRVVHGRAYVTVNLDLDTIKVPIFYDVKE